MASFKQPYPDLSHKNYEDDFRFVAEKQQDPTGERPHRQYICDSCRNVVVRRLPRVPEYDGQFLYRYLLPTDQRNPWAMKNAWLTKGWNAAYWCTACFCKRCYDYDEPLSEYDKTYVRFRLGLVNTETLNALSRGVRRYGTVHQDGPERYTIQNPQKLDVVYDSNWQGHIVKQICLRV
jgi:hypothetical protein